MIENDVAIYLLSQQPLVQLIGATPAGDLPRLFPIDRQQGSKLDAIVYQRVSTDHLECLQAAAGYATATIEFDCLSASYAGAKRLAEVLRTVLDGFRGTMGNQPIKSCRIQDEADDFDAPADGSSKGTYHVTVTYDFQFTESVPSFS